MLVCQKHKQHCWRYRHAAYSHHHYGTPGEGAESTDAMVLLFVIVDGRILDKSGLEAVDFS